MTRPAILPRPVVAVRTNKPHCLFDSTRRFEARRGKVDAAVDRRRGKCKENPCATWDEKEAAVGPALFFCMASMGCVRMMGKGPKLGPALTFPVHQI